MRIIQRYLVREILPYMLLGTVLLTAVIFIHEASRFADLFLLFARAGISDNSLFKMLAGLLPSILVFTLPISLLLGVLLGLSRMSGDSEIIALRAAGIGRSKVLTSVIPISLFVALITAYLTFNLLPQAITAFGDLKLTRTQAMVRGIAGQIKPHVFIENFPGKVVYIQDIDKEKNQWSHIFVSSDDSANPESKDDTKVITAQSGEFQLGQTMEQSQLNLFHGISQTITTKDGQTKDDVVKFERFFVKLAGKEDESKKPEEKPAEITPN